MKIRPHSDFPEPQIERVTTRTIFNSVLAILNLEKGVFYTVWEMIKSPGSAMRRYLFEDRSKFIEPLKFLVLTIPIYIFLSIKVFPESSLFIGMEEVSGQGINEERDAQLKLLMQYLKEYFNLILLLTIPISAIWTRILFHKYRLTFGEHLVLNAFLYGFLTFVMIGLMPLNFWSSKFTVYLNVVINISYITYFIRDFFRKSWASSITYSFLMTVLSFVSSFLGMLLVISLIMAGINLF